MIQVQFVIEFDGATGVLKLALNQLSREDANDEERELARALEELHVALVKNMEIPPGGVTIAEIGREEHSQ